MYLVIAKPMAAAEHTMSEYFGPFESSREAGQFCADANAGQVDFIDSRKYNCMWTGRLSAVKKSRWTRE